MTKEFDLSKEIRVIDKWGNEPFVDVLKVEKVKEFITLIQTKVLMDWKGQNEFIDWLKNKVGEKLK